MAHSWIFLTLGIMIALIVLGVAAISAALEQLPFREKSLTITGEVVCLPHKKGIFGGGETLECAIGFLGKNGKHYGLDLPEQYSWLFSANGSGESFSVTGTLIPDPESRYDIVGIMNVTSASILLENHAELRLTAIDPRLWLQTTEFVEVTDSILDESPKLKEAVKEVRIRYDRIVQECPSTLYCYLSATTYTTALSREEFESLDKTFEFTTYEKYNDGRMLWHENMKYLCYSEGFGSYPDVGDDYCYYSLDIETSLVR